MSETDPDDALLEDLRSLIERADPVPSEVTEFAKAALGWRRLDAELAELLSDSALEPGAAALTRSDDRARWIVFRAADLTIELELQAAAGGHIVLGQLTPAPGAATVEAQGPDGAAIASTETDELGRFRLVLERPARVRLRVLRDDPAGPPVETSWVSL